MSEGKWERARERTKEQGGEQKSEGESECTYILTAFRYYQYWKFIMHVTYNVNTCYRFSVLAVNIRTQPSYMLVACRETDNVKLYFHHI